MDYILKKRWPDFWNYAEQIIDIENYSFPTPWSAKAFVAETEKQISNFWALVDEDNIIGYVCFWMLEPEIHIINFAVKFEKRNKGIGKLLLKHVIDIGTGKKIEKVWLEVRPSNLPAISIYKKFGFYETGRRIGYYSGTGEDAIIMKLDIRREYPDLKASNY
ncbi:ribosomal protein S18-alanine N-acetyltransferase [Thermodesulfobacteriota bacterium]